MKKFNVQAKVLKKSVDLFYRYGYASASIRDIVKAVGISNSTVYLYFKNKEEILFNIIYDVGVELLEELQTVIEKYDDHRDVVKCLRAMIFKQIRFSQKKYKEMKIFFEEGFRLPAYLRKKTYTVERQIYGLYYSKVSELEENGLLKKKADKIVVTFSIFSMMNWVPRWFKPGGRLSLEETAENVINVFFRGILENRAAKGEE